MGKNIRNVAVLIVPGSEGRSTIIYTSESRDGKPFTRERYWPKGRATSARSGRPDSSRGVTPEEMEGEIARHLARHPGTLLVRPS